jgi:hypothetical protein
MWIVSDCDMALLSFLGRIVGETDGDRLPWITGETRKKAKTPARRRKKAAARASRRKNRR